MSIRYTKLNNWRELMKRKLINIDFIFKIIFIAMGVIFFYSAYTSSGIIDFKPEIIEKERLIVYGYSFMTFLIAFIIHKTT